MLCIPHYSSGTGGEKVGTVVAEMKGTVQLVANEDGIAIGGTDGAYPVWSPHAAFDGAATLLRVLEREKAAS